jgi:hypothetical protein
MMTNDNKDMVIATAAGSGIRGASPAQDAGKFIELSPGNWTEENYVNPDALSLADFTGIALMDAVIHNGDRHIENWMFSDLGSDVPGNVSQIPFAIDHGGSRLEIMIGNRGYYFVESNRLPYSNVIEVLRDGIFVNSDAAFKTAMIEAANNAIKRIENSGLYDLNDETVVLILTRLKSIATWY